MLRDSMPAQVRRLWAVGCAATQAVSFPHALSCLPNHLQMYEHVDELAPALLKSLSDTSDKVVKLDLEVLAELSSADEGESEERQEQADLFFKRCVKA